LNSSPLKRVELVLVVFSNRDLRDLGDVGDGVLWLFLIAKEGGGIDRAGGKSGRRAPGQDLVGGLADDGDRRPFDPVTEVERRTEPWDVGRRVDRDQFEVEFSDEVEVGPGGSPCALPG